jgi:hypothetical protein
MVTANSDAKAGSFDATVPYLFFWRREEPRRNGSLVAGLGKACLGTAEYYCT